MEDCLASLAKSVFLPAAHNRKRLPLKPSQKAVRAFLSRFKVFGWLDTYIQQNRGLNSPCFFNHMECFGLFIVLDEVLCWVARFKL